MNERFKRAYILYANETYFDIISTCVKSIRTFSQLPIIVYLLNSDKKVEGENVLTINWACDVERREDPFMYETKDDNFYINRSNEKIYRLLIQRPSITIDALNKYADTVTYIDSDMIVNHRVDSIFDFYDEESPYPYLTEGVHDWLHFNGRGGAMSRDDLSTTLEHPLCTLLGIDQYVRERYRTTNIYVAGQKSIPFLEEWEWTCRMPKIMKDHVTYAPFHEETVINCLLWKYKYLKGLPYVYINGSLDTIKKLRNQIEFKPGLHYITDWSRIPEQEELFIFVHGEKRIPVMEAMIEELKDYQNPKKVGKRILFLAPHLSTGGMPAFLLKRIQSLKQFEPYIEVFVVEYQCYSMDFVVQRNAVMELVGDNFKTLYENKEELFDILNKWKPDVVHIDDMSERLDRDIMKRLYSNERTYKIVETCHDIMFNPDKEKVFHPDLYAFCTPYHLETFKNMPSLKDVIEFPIENRNVTAEDKLAAKHKLGLNLNKKHVLNVGLWTRGKNQGEGLEIARKYPLMHFHFVGNQAGNFKDYWEPLMKQVPSNVTIWGEKDNIDEFMTAADIFMFNSTFECNPLVIREAIGYGLPIIARNLPQYGNMFTDYIQPIDTDLETIKMNYIIPTNNTIEFFGDRHKQIYKTVETTTLIPINKMKTTNFKVSQHFVEQPFLEFTGESDSTFNVRFFDEENNCIYNADHPINRWIKLNRRYFTKWRTEIREDGELIYENILDFTNKRVFITFDSESLGDTICWMPYALEFKKKHNCHVIVSTYKNFLFKEVYPELEFVPPGTTVHNLQGMYRLGWHYNPDSEPVLPNTIPLQKAATNILGLEYKEIIPRIHHKPGKRRYKKKYVAIATNSTAGCKFWTKEGWQGVIDYLYGLGYEVVNISKEVNDFNHATQILDSSMQNTMDTIYYSEFVIGLSSGLSWLAWAMNKKVVMISNFTEANHEFTTNCIRVTNTSVCHGCWNNPNFKFDKGDWDWCPINKGTPKHFECHRSITSQDVIEKLKPLL